MQPKLPLTGFVLYECVNPDCFYDGALMDINDVVWRDKWLPSIGDLAMFPFCPSCNEMCCEYHEESDGLPS